MGLHEPIKYAVVEQYADRDEHTVATSMVREDAEYLGFILWNHWREIGAPCHVRVLQLDPEGRSQPIVLSDLLIGGQLPMQRNRDRR